MKKDDPIQVLMITSEWPTVERPDIAPFIVRQAEYLRLAGVDVDVFDFRGGGNPFHYLRAWIKLQKHLVNLKYNLIHAQFGQSGLLAIFPKRLPLVVTFRGSDVRGIVGASGRYTLNGYILQFLSQVVARLADQAIVVSESLIPLLPYREYQIIPSGLDLSLFKPASKEIARQRLSLIQNEFIVLFSGSKKEPRKRYSLAQQVIDILLNDTIDTMNIRLLVLDSVAHSDVPLYMNACDVLLSTSLHEGSPNMIKEALACNLPVVSTDVGDVRERIGNIEGCEVCANDHPETIAVALKRVLSRGQRINGRQAVLELDEKLLTQKVIQVYHRAIQKKKQT
jgi:teichuronic acid biosynthesis glycosyltransferase TuaC